MRRHNGDRWRSGSGFVLRSASRRFPMMEMLGICNDCGSGNGLGAMFSGLRVNGLVLLISYQSGACLVYGAGSRDHRMLVSDGALSRVPRSFFTLAADQDD